MRIAVATGLVRNVSSKSTGGTEMFTHIITEGLVSKGIETTLFATSDSETKATLESICSSEQTNGIYEGGIEIRLPYEILLAEKIAKSSASYDLIHNNLWNYYILPSFNEFFSTPLVTTIHNNYWEMPNLKKLLVTTHRKGKDTIVFLSKIAQERAQGAVDSVVINNGIDETAFPFSSKDEGYILFLSRMVRSKGMEVAVNAAHQSGFKLILAGIQSTRPDEVEYFDKNIRPLIKDNITYLQAPHFNKVNLYQNAKAFIFPALAEEQFPLTVLEAMSCGTPVIAYNRGAIAEEVQDGITGFIIDPDEVDRPGKGSWVIKKTGIAGIIEAVNRIDEIDRGACRAHVEKYFTQERMIDDYIALYQRILRK